MKPSSDEGNSAARIPLRTHRFGKFRMGSAIAAHPRLKTTQLDSMLFCPYAATDAIPITRVARERLNVLADSQSHAKDRRLHLHKTCALYSGYKDSLLGVGLLGWN